MRAAEIRELFLKFFEKQGHTRVASSSLIPIGDPTLYFTNAGMVQFKDAFLGAEKRSYKRATTSQKCMRVSGKHNDLENVGYTPRHHTFFEMLGNFSFGDYFKEEAIAFAWEFLTEIVKLPKEKLYITVFEKDDEAEKLWQKYVSKDRIFRLGEKDNFWAMGDTGPCGPCSEILWDFGSGKVTKKNLEGDRLFELWNLVFMQFNRSSDGQLTPLPKPSVDTGMGLERLACVIQGKKSNWETDLFQPIINAVVLESNQATVAEYLHDTQPYRVALRVIADHVRAATFLIADGLLPSNEGRGYVLRRIIRRAVRYYNHSFFVTTPILYKIAETVIKEMTGAYPELTQSESLIKKVLEVEETKFLQTIGTGTDLLLFEIEELKKKNKAVIPGEVVFKFYDTYGFPKDLTDLIARERGFAIDEQGFEKEMAKQRERARKSWKGSGSIKVDAFWKELRDQSLSTKFVGYEKESATGEILNLVKNGKIIDEVKEGEQIQLVVDMTPFYAEGGGQVGDTGVASKEGVDLKITDTQQPFRDIYYHHAEVIRGELRPGEKIILSIDSGRRQKIRSNHTATHLIHAALRQILGTHVKQAGSYLDDHYLRFDFSHFEAITDKQLTDIEDLVNKVVRQNLPLKTEVLPYKEAIAKGALAYFGEKYGEIVRVVQIPNFSTELCGGTHTATTGEIGLIKITKERSVASGVRRVEAVSGSLAQEWVTQHKAEVEKGKAIEEEKKIKKDQVKGEKSLRLRTAIDAFDSLTIKNAHGVKVLAAEVSVADAGELREVAEAYKQKLGSGIVVLGADTGGKAALVVMVTKDLTSKYSAGDLMKKLAPLVGGTGGGRSDMAQGGGPKVDELRNALEKVASFLSL